ncbi:MAG: hypothetical protein COB49_10420 [Alphaproteobacteria bacterium]|nr:MAG: hypothetical protein COB49_10420 [Alphaproteobacteria bacterium]
MQSRRLSSNSFCVGKPIFPRVLRNRQGAVPQTHRHHQHLVERNINIQPTITIRPGYPLQVIVHKDIILTAYGDIK